MVSQQRQVVYLESTHLLLLLLLSCQESGVTLVGWVTTVNAINKWMDIECSRSVIVGDDYCNAHQECSRQCLTAVVVGSSLLQPAPPSYGHLPLPTVV